MNSRANRAKLNIMTTLIRQLLATVCGIVIPWVMIGAFGSTVYGATASIAQFLSYIALLEGGIGSVARGALYGPLAEQNNQKISNVLGAIKRFFKTVGLLFAVYTLVLAFFYYDIADIQVFDRKYTFFLVIAISLFTFFNYMLGLSNLTLLNAHQKQYLSEVTVTITNVLNTVCIVLLATGGADVLTVKLVSSVVFIARPVIYAYYVRKNYHLPKAQRDDTALSQKWAGMGQHVAYFLHTNTDIVLLTIFADLKTVAVYSVYRLVATSLWNISSAFTGGMEAVFGEMIAKKEEDVVRSSYEHYRALLTLVCVALFGAAIALVVPFVKLYTKDVSDANYIQPLFAIFILLSEGVNTLILPSSGIPIAANKLKDSRWGSYCEAIINIVLSMILIWWEPLLGVAIGTLIATIFKGIYYICYSEKHILHRKAAGRLVQYFATILVIAGFGAGGMYLLQKVNISGYMTWMLYGVGVFAAALAVAVIFCRLAYPKECGEVLRKLTKKFRRHG